MIPGLNDFLLSLKGAWRLFLWDREGLEDLDQTINGFWSSFWAPVAAFPAFLLYALASLAIEIENIALLEEPIEYTPPNTGNFLVTGGLSYAAEVAIFPLLMILVSRGLGLTHRYVPYIIAWNWTNALFTGLMAVPGLLYVAGALSATGAFAIMFVILLASLACLYFIAQAALEVRPHLAILVVGFNFVLSLLISNTFTAII